MTDVILDKQSDGSWQAAKRVSDRLNLSAWKRLWIVAGFMYLLMLLATCYVVVPTRDRVDRRMVQSVTDEVRRFDGMAFAGESPQAVFDRARSMGYDTWVSSLRSRYRIGLEGDAGFNRIGQEYRESITSLPTKHFVAVLICSVAWIVPMAVLYAVGFTVDWIKRGVRMTRQ